MNEPSWSYIADFQMPGLIAGRRRSIATARCCSDEPEFDILHSYGQARPSLVARLFGAVAARFRPVHTAPARPTVVARERIASTEIQQKRVA